MEQALVEPVEDYETRHSAGEIRAASPARRAAILDNIHAGIRAGQCDYDLRNPEGKGCLGSVRALMSAIA